MRDILNDEKVYPILQALAQAARAKIYEGSTQAPFAIQKLELELDTARTEENPYRIGFPFKAVYVQSATDTSTVIKFKPQTKDTFQSAVELGRKDVLNFEYPLSEAFLHWDAQTNKSVTLIFFVDAEFKSGSQISQNSGGVSINDGSTVSAPTQVTLSATTAAIICPANSDRKVATIENATGADLYIGGDNTITNSGATRGIKIANGEKIVYRNTAALYGYSVAGGDVHYIEEE